MVRRGITVRAYGVPAFPSEGNSMLYPDPSAGRNAYGTDLEYEEVACERIPCAASVEALPLVYACSDGTVVLPVS